MTIIIGVDPGSRYTGYGIVRWEQNQSFYVDSGHIKLSHLPWAERLQAIFAQLTKVMLQYRPDAGAIEQVFMHQNPGSALKLGQARGAAIVALNIPVAEYSARQVKQSVVGYGAADKAQIQHMVKRLLNLNQALQADEADALAIALCHIHHSYSASLKALVGKKQSWRHYKIPLERD